MDNRIYGYARVSTREQNEDRQIEALTKFGVPEQNISISICSRSALLSLSIFAQLPSSLFYHILLKKVQCDTGLFRQTV